MSSPASPSADGPQLGYSTQSGKLVVAFSVDGVGIFTLAAGSEPDHIDITCPPEFRVLADSLINFKWRRDGQCWLLLNAGTIVLAGVTAHIEGAPSVVIDEDRLKEMAIFLWRVVTAAETVAEG